MGVKASENNNTIRKICCEMGMCQGGGSQKRLGEAEKSTSGIFFEIIQSCML